MILPSLPWSRPIMIGLLAALSAARTPASAQEPRFPPMTVEATTGDQRVLAERLLKETRGGLGGPWGVVLRSPEVGKGILELYSYYRWRTPLPQRLVEFGILVTAREWSSSYEWFIHYPLAVKQGVPPAVLARLREGQRPDGMSDDEEIVYTFGTELLRHHRVSDATFARTKARFGDQGVIDLTTLIGTYVSVAGVLNVGQVEGAAKDGPEFLPPLSR